MLTNLKKKNTFRELASKRLYSKKKKTLLFQCVWAADDSAENDNLTSYMNIKSSLLTRWNTTWGGGGGGGGGSCSRELV